MSELSTGTMRGAHAEESAPAPAKKLFTLDHDDVIAAERPYLEARRSNNTLPSVEAEPLWGLAFSGGGVRSATFCLGVIQALTRAGVMKRFDYLSTVSGGGYIGSCLSSLLTGDSEMGLDDDHSPFTGLRSQEGYRDPEHTRLSARHQIHHLRTHGEYLIPHSRLMSRDVQRAVGSVLPGTFHTLILFVLFLVVGVALTHLVLSGIDRNLAVLAPTGHLVIDQQDTMSTLEYVKTVPVEWFRQRLAPPFSKLTAATWLCWPCLLLAVIVGALWSAAAIARATAVANAFPAQPKPPTPTTPAGWNAEDERESRFVWRFNVGSVVLALALMTLVSFYYHRVGLPDMSLGALLVPLAMAVGGLFASETLTHVLQSSFARRSWVLGSKIRESRFRRSLYASLRGACLYGAAGAVVTPVLLVVLFALAHLPLKFFLALIALAIGRWASRGSGAPSALQLGGWRQRPLANTAVLVFLAFAFAQVSSLLLRFYRAVDPQTIWRPSLLAIGVAAASIVLLGLFIDANRISPHYFYRDRLTEAYLKTDARTVRPSNDRQGMPLTVLRDNEDLRLSDLGNGNGRGPYHLIVAAMNLAGSRELNRKSFLSEHFIFSREYIGSRVTGWVDTKAYRDGTTRLARAMAISAAAVGSAMGPNTFAAQAFVTTLLNARLGFWTENPWLYRKGKPHGARNALTFWPKYLVIEALGLSTARTKRVNVSDGGHTGDNLGLLPLLQRRCSTILVCDAEADGDFDFSSFNNAVRMALTEENIAIDIDLTPIADRKETAGGFKTSTTNVAVGEIRYPPRLAGAKPDRLVYVKASIPHANCPVHVANYAKGHQQFPHETTADQFFDDAQFEAYRALGEHLGQLAAGHL
jgi:hypothetical protein